MQSLLQYRRFRQHVDQQIKQRGLAAAAGIENDFSINATCESANSTATRESIEEPEVDLHVDGVAPSQATDSSPTTFVSDQLHNVPTGVPFLDCTNNDTGHKRDPEKLLIVNFQTPKDPFNPQTWSQARKWTYTFLVGETGFIVSGSSAFDTEVAPQAAKYFGVSEEVALLNTTLYMIALGLGSLISAPFSETVGRNPVYIICITAFALFEMGAALAHNIETYLICRLLAALFGCPPLTTFGGSISDMWSPLDRTYVFPIISVPTFMFPFLAPMVAAFIATSPLVSWQWTDWITVILAGSVVGSLTLFVPETYGPVLLSWKAKHLRSITGDERYRAAHELRQTNLGMRLWRSLARPIKFLLTEPIVDLCSLYLVVVYVILFGFLPGFNFIFGEDGIYGLDQRHTGLCFIAVNVGFLFALIPIQPLYRRFKTKLAVAQDAGIDKVEPEERLWFAMIGAPFMTIAIFWMGWSSWPGVSYWSPIVATAFFGFGTMGVFISCYQYIIDSFEVYAASALVGMTVTRYCVAGPMVIVSVPMYHNLGVHWALTLVGCLSLLMTPVPYIFYKYGAVIRKRSRSATNFG